MDDLINPYQPLPDSDIGLAPFVGRKPAFARLHQYLRDPHNAQALLYLGRRLTGKTAFLQRCEVMFDDGFIGVYIPLREHPLRDESDFLNLLVRRSLAVLTNRDLTLSRLPEWPDTQAHMRGWLHEAWLPAVWQVIRPHRQLVWLVDDVDVLVNAVDRGAIPGDIFAHLSDLLVVHPQLRLVLTLAEAHEQRLLHMQPLVDIAQVQRLLNLTADDSAALLREPVGQLYTVTDDGVAEVYQMTGGQPQWLQRVAFHVYRLWETQTPQNVIRPDEIKSLFPQVYAQSSDELHAIWADLTDNERLLLTAISQLYYDDPLRPIDTPALAAWLVETDYPLDATAIHAVIRSLDYREIIRHQPGGALRLSSQLMQRWLLENADLLPRTSSVTRPTTVPFDWRIVAVLAALGVILLLIVLAASGGSPAMDDAPPPTVTLVSP